LISPEASRRVNHNYTAESLGIDQGNVTLRLYDLASDEGEQNDLSRNPAYAVRSHRREAASAVRCVEHTKAPSTSLPIPRPRSLPSRR